MCFGPGGDGAGFFGSPHEGAVDFTQVTSVGTLPLGADHIIKSECIGEWAHEGFG